MDAFLTLSSTVTAYSRFRLVGTGQAEAYLETVVRVAGEGLVDELLAASERVHQAAAGDEAELLRLLRAEVLSDARLGPVARGIVTMWFVGTWYQLPQDWRDAVGATGEPEGTFVVHPVAYTEGLLWDTIGANPPGAKGPGYATWTGPPRIPGRTA